MSRSAFAQVVVLFIALIAGATGAAQDARPSAADLHDAYAQGVEFVDVRSDSEWAAGHLDNAVHVPVDQVTDRAASALPDKNKPLVLYCGSGRRAQTAAETLRGLGYTNVTAMTGGYVDLKAAGFPVAP